MADQYEKLEYYLRWYKTRFAAHAKSGANSRLRLLEWSAVLKYELYNLILCNTCLQSVRVTVFRGPILFVPSRAVAWLTPILHGLHWWDSRGVTDTKMGSEDMGEASDQDVMKRAGSMNVSAMDTHSEVSKTQSAMSEARYRAQTREFAQAWQIEFTKMFPQLKSFHRFIWYRNELFLKSGY